MASTKENCHLCHGFINIYGYGSCNHPVCYKCVARMRVICKDNFCAICRTEIEMLVLLKDHFIPFETLDTRNFNHNKNYNILFQNYFVKQKYHKLFKELCPECYECFPRFPELQRHVQREHAKYYCNICVDNLKIFPYERKCYTKDQLMEHNKKGDSDDQAYKGHPLCEYCKKRFLDKDELNSHMHKDHFHCHFCDEPIFYSDYQLLEQHFSKKHFVCSEDECESARFTNVFNSDVELRTHRATVHLKNMKKAHIRQELTLDIPLNLPPRPFRRKGGRAYKPNANQEQTPQQSDDEQLNNVLGEDFTTYDHSHFPSLDCTDSAENLRSTTGSTIANHYAQFLGHRGNSHGHNATGNFHHTHLSNSDIVRGKRVATNRINPLDFPSLPTTSTEISSSKLLTANNSKLDNTKVQAVLSSWICTDGYKKKVAKSNIEHKISEDFQPPISARNISVPIDNCSNKYKSKKGTEISKPSSTSNNNRNQKNLNSVSSDKNTHQNSFMADKSDKFISRVTKNNKQDVRCSNNESNSDCSGNIKKYTKPDVQHRSKLLENKIYNSITFNDKGSASKLKRDINNLVMDSSNQVKSEKQITEIEDSNTECSEFNDLNCGPSSGTLFYAGRGHVSSVVQDTNRCLFNALVHNNPILNCPSVSQPLPAEPSNTLDIKDFLTKPPDLLQSQNMRSTEIPISANYLSLDFTPQVTNNDDGSKSISPDDYEISNDIDHLKYVNSMESANGHSPGHSVSQVDDPSELSKQDLQALHNYKLNGSAPNNSFLLPGDPFMSGSIKDCLSQWMSAMALPPPPGFQAIQPPPGFSKIAPSSMLSSSILAPKHSMQQENST